MSIEPYALQVGLGIDDASKDRAADDDTKTGLNIEVYRTPDSPTSTPYLIGQTPIADVYSTPSSSLYCLQPPQVKAKGFFGSTTSLNHLGVLLADGVDQEEDDWSRSVLLAADLKDTAALGSGG